MIYLQLGQQVDKESKVIRNEKRIIITIIIVKKSCFKIFFSNFDLQFSKNCSQLANCEALFCTSSIASKGRVARL